MKKLLQLQMDLDDVGVDEREELNNFWLVYNHLPTNSGSPVYVWSVINSQLNPLLSFDMHKLIKPITPQDISTICINIIVNRNHKTFMSYQAGRG